MTAKVEFTVRFTYSIRLQFSSRIIMPATAFLLMGEKAPSMFALMKPSASGDQEEREIGSASILY